MNRKITARALAVTCGFFGAMGLAKRLCPSVAIACRARKPSPESMAVSATEANPPPASHKNSRRVRPQNWPRGDFDVLVMGMRRSEERRVGKECRDRGGPYH